MDQGCIGLNCRGGDLLHERDDLVGTTNQIIPLLVPVELSGSATSIVELYAVGHLGIPPCLANGFSLCMQEIE